MRLHATVCICFCSWRNWATTMWSRSSERVLSRDTSAIWRSIVAEAQFRRVCFFSQISRTKPNRPDLTWPDLLKAGMRDILSASVFLIYLFLFFNDFCETNYLKVYWTDIRQIFRVGCMINIKLVFPSSRDVAMTAILLVLSQKWTSLDTGS